MEIVPSKKERPYGVTGLAVLFFVLALFFTFSILSPFSFIFSGGNTVGWASNFIIPIIAIIAGVGLLFGRRYGWVLAILLPGFFLYRMIFPIFLNPYPTEVKIREFREFLLSGRWSLVIFPIAIIIYLIFSKEVRAYFALSK